MSSPTSDAGTAKEAAVHAAPPLSEAAARYALLLLVLVSVLNHLDRNIVSILLEPIKHDLHVSDSAMGLLTGFAFALLYSTVSLPVGLIADRFNRKVILTASLALWSGMTVLCSATTSYLAIFITRAGVGAGEAGGIPATTSLVGDLFRPEKRSSANAWIGLGATFGAAAGLAIGGIVNHYWGWRVAFIAAGAPGLLLALVIALTLREPERGRHDAAMSQARAGSASATFRDLLGNRLLMHLIFGGALGNICNGIITWLPAYYSRSYGISTAELGTWMMAIQATGSLIGVIGAGKLADRLYTRDPRWQAWIIAITTVACAPFLLAVLLVPSLTWSLLLLIPAMAFKFAYLGPYNATLIALAGPRNRATAAAIAMFAVNLIGLGLGPLIVGLLSDHFGHGTPGGLRIALCALTPILLWSAYHSYKAAGPSRAAAANI